jgi:Nuclear transport factor 2 (NTF2) domain
MCQSLPFQKVAHRVSTLDAQPNGFGNGAIVMVTGELLVATPLML